MTICGFNENILSMLDTYETEDIQQAINRGVYEYITKFSINDFEE